MAGKAQHSSVQQGITRGQISTKPAVRYPETTGIKTHSLPPQGSQTKRENKWQGRLSHILVLWDYEGTDYVWRMMHLLWRNRLCMENDAPTLIMSKRVWNYKQLSEGRWTYSRLEDLKELKKLAKCNSACLYPQPFGNRGRRITSSRLIRAT